MSYLRKWASVLAAFSLSVTLLTGMPAQASGLAQASEAIEDPQSDAAALGNADSEEGTASAGAQEGDGEEQDVMETLTGEADPDLLTDTGESASDAGDTSGDGASDAGDTSDDGASDAGDTSGDGASDEEEAAAEGETPVEEETASSGIKEDEAEGQNVTEEEESALPFADVPPSHWSYPFVLYAYEHNLVRGVSETAFNPTGVMTRAAFVTVLYRFSQTIDADMSMSENVFTDIDNINPEFQSAVLWAAAHGIVTGRADATFAPGENVTRQQMCAILVRYLRDYLRYDLSAYVGADIFADSDSISSYAKESVSIMQGMDIISGREADGVTIFDPAGSASRAAVVKVLSSAVQQIPDLTKLPEIPDDGASDTDDGASDTGESAAETDTGDSGDSADTGDSGKKTSSGGGGGGSGGGGGGGSSSGGGGGGSSSGGGGGGSSSGGGSSGESVSSGGSSSDDNGNSSETPSGPSPDEPAEAAEVFGYIDEMLSAYEANPPTDETSKAYMELLMPNFQALRDARNSGVIVDADYFNAHFAGEMDKLLKKYSVTTIDELMQVMNYVRTISTSAKMRQIADYFGISEILLGS